jgi:hypothetical protein
VSCRGARVRQRTNLGVDARASSCTLAVIG